jgi:hypothetical protein
MPLHFGTLQVDVAWGLASHPTGVYVVGLTNGALHGPQRGEGDAFVRKYGADGGVLWAEQFGTARWDDAQGVAVDPRGNVYVAGFTYGSLVVSQGESDSFLRKHSADGRVLWTRQFGGADQEHLGRIALFGDDVYLVGNTVDPVTGQTDAYLQKFDSSGKKGWHRVFGTTRLDYASGVATDGAGNVYVVGLWDALATPDSVTRSDMFIRKYTPAGGIVWTRRLDYGEVENAYGVAVVDSSVYLAGHHTLPGDPDNRDALIVNLGTDGSKVWERRFDLGGNDYVFEVGAQGEEVVFSGETVNAAGDSDGYVVKLTAEDGGEVWRTRLVTPEMDIAWAVAYTPTGVYAAGETGGTNESPEEADEKRVRLGDATGRFLWADP